MMIQCMCVCVLAVQSDCTAYSPFTKRAFVDGVCIVLIEQDKLYSDADALCATGPNPGTYPDLINGRLAYVYNTDRFNAINGFSLENVTLPIYLHISMMLCRSIVDSKYTKYIINSKIFL